MTPQPTLLPFLAVSLERIARPDDYFRTLAELLPLIPRGEVAAVCDRIVAGYRRGATLFVFGNGGSAALASHLACDLGKGTATADAPRLRVLALTDNFPLLSAWANDVDYTAVFAEQISGLGSAGDLAFAISGSGNSGNVLAGLRAARALGMQTLGLSGFHGGAMAALCDPCLVVPCDNMQLIEDCHLVVSHALFLAVRHALAHADVPEANACIATT